VKGVITILISLIGLVTFAQNEPVVVSTVCVLRPRKEVGQVEKNTDLLKAKIAADNVNKTSLVQSAPIIKFGPCVATSSKPAIPLYMLDGKEASSNIIEKLNPLDVSSIQVIAPKNAKQKYGRKAKYGAILITMMKRGVPIV
jgi:hypothetical protein